jgi:lysophospholipid acyltransferase (LPLAT)-like uncharacterized protein
VRFLAADLLAPPSAAFVWTVQRTSRLIVLDESRAEPPDPPAIACFWHGQVMAILALCVALRSSRLPACCLEHDPPVPCAAPRGEGRLFAKMLRWLGIDSLAAAAGARETHPGLRLSRALSRGSSIILSADGPRGPRLCAAPGLIRLAAISGAPLLPIGTASSQRWVLPTWDRASVPMPFARLAYVLGDPLRVAPGASREAHDDARRTLDERLNAATAEAERLCRQQP